MYVPRPALHAAILSKPVHGPRWFLNKKGKSMFNKIKEFHEKFGLEYNGDPRQLSAEMQKFRCKFLLEEITEYLMATMDGDIVEQLDALVDIVYVALGTAYLQGFDFNEAFRRVHEQNMKKVRVENPSESKRGTSFDVIKPPGWTHASLVDLCQPTDRAIVHNNYKVEPLIGTDKVVEVAYQQSLNLELIKNCDNCGKANNCALKQNITNPERLSSCRIWRSANG